MRRDVLWRGYMSGCESVELDQIVIRAGAFIRIYAYCLGLSLSWLEIPDLNTQRWYTVGITVRGPDEDEAQYFMTLSM